MGLKKKLAMGIATGALAVSMIGGGTYAYFSAETSATSAFAAGTLDLAVNPSVIIDIKDLKPGDFMDRYFTVENTGSLDISEVLLTTKVDSSIPEFGDHLMVKFMQNMDKNGHAYPDSVIYEATLNQLMNEKPDIVDKLSNSHTIDNEGGLGAGDTDNLIVRFEFIETGKDDQNHLQGATLDLEWTFTAKQTEGERK